MLIWLVYGIVLTLILCTKIYLYRKYGRKFIKVSDYVLEIKHSYFKIAEQIAWSSIKEIMFSGRKFKIKLINSTEILFKAPLDKYLDLRHLLKSSAEINNVYIYENESF